MNDVQITIKYICNCYSSHVCLHIKYRYTYQIFLCRRHPYDPYNEKLKISLPNLITLKNKNEYNKVR